MPVTSDGEQSFPASQILIGEVEYTLEENVMTPFRKVTVIYANGGIWDLQCKQFGVDSEGRPVGEPTEGGVRALWDSAPQHFTKREQ